MSNFEGVTFAFSHKNKVWRTRYSFTPTAYAYVDNYVLSTNGRHPSSGSFDPLTSNSFWLHDANSSHNNFYGYQYDMSLAFVSNYNPSSVKMFKSLSAESNSNSWSGFVTTNNNPSGSDQTEAQRATLNTFTRKEGTSYVDIPPSESNSSSNISSAFSALGGIGYNISPDMPDTLNPNNPEFTWVVDIDVQYGQVIAGKNCFVVVRGDQGLSYIQGNQLVPIASITPSYEQGFAVISKFDADNYVVEMTMKVPISAIDSYPFPTWSADGLYSAIYVDTPSKTNGDYMKGHYMNVYLSNSSTSPVECLAFNVNYEATKLDHSLGQNA